MPKKKATQIEAIASSIAPILLGIEEEKIKAFAFKVQEQNPPYTTEISKLSKEKEALAHIAYIASKSNSNSIYFYLDALSTLEGVGIGVGIVAYN